MGSKSCWIFEGMRALSCSFKPINFYCFKTCSFFSFAALLTFWYFQSYSLVLQWSIARRVQRVLLSGLLLVENRVIQTEMLLRILLLESPTCMHSHSRMVSCNFILSISFQSFEISVLYNTYIIQVSGLIIVLLLRFVYATIFVIDQGDWRLVLLHFLSLDYSFVLHSSGYVILWASSGYWDLQLFPRWFVNWRHDDTWHTRWGIHLDWSMCWIKRET